LPDNYADRLTASARSRFEALPSGGTRRSSRGELKVRMPLVGGRVEQTIVGDLRAHLGDEARIVDEHQPRLDR